MELIFQEFKSLLKGHLIQINNKYLNTKFQQFSFHLICKNNHNPIKITDIDKITKTLQEKVYKNIFISQYFEKDSKYNFNSDFFILCFENSVVIIEQTEINLFYNFFSQNQRSTIHILTENIQKFIEQKLNIKLNFSNKNENHFLFQEIQSFSEKFCFKKNKMIIKRLKNIENLFKIIIEAISAFCIIKSYDKTISYDRILNIFDYQNKSTQKELNNDEYIVLGQSNQNSNNVNLIYHIEREELFILKLYPNGDELFERERNNYKKVLFPLFPKFFGITKSYMYKCIVIEYIHGYALNSINEMKLTIENKIIIVFQIMIALEYLHFEGFVYRDLKPDNIIINEKGSITIIDFDRMLPNTEELFTQDFQHEFIAPEIISGKNFSSKSDVYSLGKIIEYIFPEQMPNEYKYEYSILHQISEECTKIDETQRPNISELIYEFNYKLLPKIIKFNYTIINSFIDNPGKLFYNYIISEYNNLYSQYFLGVLHFSQDIVKSIYYFTQAANQNHLEAQYHLGFIFYSGEYVPRDINKSIYYLTLAANRNHKEAEYLLGILYKNGKYVSQDIDKSIYYFTQAANHNHLKAQYHLGLMLYKGQYTPQDIIKSIQYLTLAAHQNHGDAALFLGLLYEKSPIIPRDINKSIYYCSLAANQNNSNAQFILGSLYEEGEYVPQDINKSIYYYSLAAKSNHSYAQYKLGTFYEGNQYVPQDINKSIYYYTLAANQNITEAQINLGFLFLKGQYIQRDIKKSIYYFTLTANQNNPNIQYLLGMLYQNEEMHQKNINKSIYYLSLAANQDDINAQVNLGILFYNGIHVKQDLQKSLYYLTLAANKNDSEALFVLGQMHIKEKNIQDIKKAIHYLTLASDQNNSRAQFFLGNIYFQGNYIERDIVKSIHYYLLSASQNNPDAQFMLGSLYLYNQYIPQDINKSVYYFSLAASLNHSMAQGALGIFYLYGLYFKKDIQKALNFLKLAGKNYYRANYLIGNIYCKGVEVDRDINKAIKYYKECSSFNHQYSKNNLGIIYKNFIQNEIAIEYFEEAIRQTNDKIAMYNLGHIYFYGEFINKNLDKSIELLIKSSNQNFYPSLMLLSMAIVTQTKPINIENISNELAKYGNKNDELILTIYKKIKDFGLEIDRNYSFLYSDYKNKEYFYDDMYNEVLYIEFLFNNHEFQTQKENNNNLKNNISQSFYEGFGFDIYYGYSNY